MVKIGMIDFEEVFQNWKENFVCDGSCNNNSDVCTHRFQFNCAFCGDLICAFGEDMLDWNEHYGEHEHCRNLQSEIEDGPDQPMFDENISLYDRNDF